MFISVLGLGRKRKFGVVNIEELQFDHSFKLIQK